MPCYVLFAIFCHCSVACIFWAYLFFFFLRQGLFVPLLLLLIVFCKAFHPMPLAALFQQSASIWIFTGKYNFLSLSVTIAYYAIALGVWYWIIRFFFFTAVDYLQISFKKIICTFVEKNGAIMLHLRNTFLRALQWGNLKSF